MKVLHFIVQYQLIVLVRKKEQDAKMSAWRLGKYHLRYGKIHAHYIGISSIAALFIHKEILRAIESAGSFRARWFKPIACVARVVDRASFAEFTNCAVAVASSGATDASQSFRTMTPLWKVPVPLRVGIIPRRSLFSPGKSYPLKGACVPRCAP
jgi:hypothetical protein